METVRLDDIVRQQDPALKHVVEQLSRGEVRGAIRDLEHQGRVHEIADRQERFTAIAQAYAEDPEGTLVVSPDNQSRMEINQTIHRLLQQTGPRPGPRASAHASSSRGRTSRAPIANGRRSTSLGTSCATRGEAARSASTAGAYARVTARARPGQRVTVDATDG